MSARPKQSHMANRGPEESGKTERRGRRRAQAEIEEVVALAGGQDVGWTDHSRANSQTDAALEVIRSRIIDMRLKPGSRIDERILTDRFRLGRTPAREAISRLVAEGFVKIIPQRGGTYVRKLDLEEMGEIVVAHQLAESVLGQLCKMSDITLLPDLKAIQRRYVEHVRKREFLMITEVNREFHLRMYRAIGNSLFYEFAESTPQARPAPQRIHLSCRGIIRSGLSGGAICRQSGPAQSDHRGGEPVGQGAAHGVAARTCKAHAIPLGPSDAEQDGRSPEYRHFEAGLLAGRGADPISRWRTIVSLRPSYIITA